MSIDELKQKLTKARIGPRSYSLDGSLEPDRFVLYNAGSKYQVFYFDERGGRNEIKEFATKSDACDYLYKRLIELEELKDKYGLH